MKLSDFSLVSELARDIYVIRGVIADPAKIFSNQQETLSEAAHGEVLVSIKRDYKKKLIATTKKLNDLGVEVDDPEE